MSHSLSCPFIPLSLPTRKKSNLAISPPRLHFHFHSHSHILSPKQTHISRFFILLALVPLSLLPA